MRENVDMMATSLLSLRSVMPIYWVPREGKEKKHKSFLRDIYKRRERERERENRYLILILKNGIRLV